jgi:hypothetical protein
VAIKNQRGRDVKPNRIKNIGVEPIRARISFPVNSLQIIFPRFMYCHPSFDYLEADKFKTARDMVDAP